MFNNTMNKRRERKEQYDYYFRINYGINQAICKPIELFNTILNLISIENFVFILFFSFLFFSSNYFFFLDKYKTSKFIWRKFNDSNRCLFNCTKIIKNRENSKKVNLFEKEKEKDLLEYCC